jgi:hypothetical protein
MASLLPGLKSSTVYHIQAKLARIVEAWYAELAGCLAFANHLSMRYNRRREML